MTDYTWQSETYSKTYWGVADITPEQQGDHIVRYLSWCSIQCLYTHSIHWEQRCTRKRQNSLKSLVHKLKTNLFKKVEVKAKVQVQTVQQSSKGKNSAKVQRQRREAHWVTNWGGEPGKHRRKGKLTGAGEINQAGATKKKTRPTQSQTLTGLDILKKKSPTFCFSLCSMAREDQTLYSHISDLCIHTVTPAPPHPPISGVFF